MTSISATPHPASPAKFTKYFESAQQVITSGSKLTIAHGLGVRPLLVQPVLVCLTAEKGYVIGDEILLQNHQAAQENRGMSLKTNATNLICQVGATTSPFTAGFWTTGVTNLLTNANWEYYFRAWA